MTKANTTPPSVIRLLDTLLDECVQRDASDVHFAPELPIYLRIQGLLEPQTDHPRIAAEQIRAIADHLASLSQRPPLQGPGSLDGAVSSSSGTRFRYNIYRRQGKLAIAMRRLEDRFRELAELGLPDSLYRLCELSDGLVLVAGPTGSGKSTTLATLLNRVNQTRRCHLVTIEDPIEYLHNSALALVNQRQVGGDTEHFHEAVVAAMRQDPDVILVGEIRDLATIRAAVTAAETGHLVFTTVHASDCVGAIERLIAVFPAEEQAGVRRQVSMVLRAIITQHLLVADGPVATGERSARASSGAGAAARRSRVVTSEILVSTPAVANLIATEKSAQIYSAMESGTAQGMQTLEQDLARLMHAGLLSEASAMAMARSPNVLRERAGRLQRGGMPATRSGGRM
ncbi:MAG: PilT/PilU family type 4a pilus ATPase [Planctomycetaceae bacterium]|nr:MAG: PilT/PilU family type 4a pilus ATPase [Planctomycetaceae bacterium]